MALPADDLADCYQLFKYHSLKKFPTGKLQYNKNGKNSAINMQSHKLLQDKVPTTIEIKKFRLN